MVFQKKFTRLVAGLGLISTYTNNNCQVRCSIFIRKNLIKTQTRTFTTFFTPGNVFGPPHFAY